MSGRAYPSILSTVPAGISGCFPCDDGGTAVCLTTSHTLVDGLGIMQAIADAANGKDPLPGLSTSRFAHARAGPASGRPGKPSRRCRSWRERCAATVRIARHRRKDVAASMASAPPSPRRAGDDQPVVVPSVTAYVDVAEWDACAKGIGGNSFTLVAGFAGRLGVRMGRVCDDGTVTLSFPVGDRTEDDTRGNALVFPTISVDPTHLSVGPQRKFVSSSNKHLPTWKRPPRSCWRRCR